MSLLVPLVRQDGHPQCCGDLFQVWHTFPHLMCASWRDEGLTSHFGGGLPSFTCQAGTTLCSKVPWALHRNLRQALFMTIQALSCLQAGRLGTDTLVWTMSSLETGPDRSQPARSPAAAPSPQPSLLFELPWS